MSRLFRAISGKRLAHLQPSREANPLQPIVDQLQREVATIVKARRGDLGPFRAFNLDPQNHQMLFQGDRPTDLHLGTDGITYFDLRRIARMSFVAPFWRRRINQAAARLKKQRGPNQPGYIIGHVDKGERLGAAHRKMIELIDQRLNRVNRDVIRGGLRYNMKGGLVGRWEFDQLCMETVLDPAGRPWGWQAVDAATIRRAKPDAFDVEHGQWGDAGYVQVLNEEIVNSWDQEHMAFMCCRPNPDINANGYGWPEIAEALDIIRDIDNAKTYNSVYFRNGVHASTILLLKSATLYTQENFDDIKADIVATLKGPHNAHRMGVLQVHAGQGDQKPESLEKIDLATNNRDMEFSHLFGFLFRLFAATMQMDLAELGIADPADTRPASIGSETSPDAAVGIAREGGLLPYLDDIEEFIDVNFVKRIHPEFQIRLDGPETSQQSRVTVFQQSINSYKSIDEIRAEDGLEPFDEDWSKMPLNPSVVQIFLNAQQQQMAQQQPQQGDPNAQPQDQGQPQQGDGSGIDWNDPKSWTEAIGKAVERKFDDGEFVHMGRPSTRSWDRGSGRYVFGHKGPQKYAVEVR